MFRLPALENGVIDVTCNPPVGWVNQPTKRVALGGQKLAGSMNVYDEFTIVVKLEGDVVPEGQFRQCSTVHELVVVACIVIWAATIDRFTCIERLPFNTDGVTVIAVPAIVQVLV